mmetsp:Transcript_41193/g.78672  ORF Transcript_41193/g.78672 Transcript_41193/m.78672 type:complete len:188 (-) Transcript_41193:1292-1855(-)
MRLLPEHHCFVQALLARGYLAEADARSLFRKIVRQNSDQGFDAFWADINREVQCADLKLQRVLYPEDNKPYIGIINTLEDEPCKLATSLTPEQLAYFRALMEHIALECDDGVDSRAALNFSVAAPTQTQRPTAKQLSAGERESTLELLASDGWLLVTAQTSRQCNPHLLSQLGERRGKHRQHRMYNC